MHWILWGKRIQEVFTKRKTGILHAERNNDHTVSDVGKNSNGDCSGKQSRGILPNEQVHRESQ